MAETQAAVEVAKQAVEPMKEFAAQMLTYLQSAVEFSQEQVPLLAQEIVWYGIAKNAFVLVVCAAVIIAGIRHIPGWIKTYDENNYHTDKYLGASIGGSIICIVAALIFMVATTQLLKAMFAPRLYLIEYLTNLVTGK